MHILENIHIKMAHILTLPVYSLFQDFLYSSLHPEIPVSDLSPHINCGLSLHLMAPSVPFDIRFPPPPHLFFRCLAHHSSMCALNLITLTGTTWD